MSHFIKANNLQSAPFSLAISSVNKSGIKTIALMESIAVIVATISKATFLYF
jgi:hypothetical protein